MDFSVLLIRMAAFFVTRANGHLPTGFLDVPVLAEYGMNSRGLALA
jgi:hypothetical protein